MSVKSEDHPSRDSESRDVESHQGPLPLSGLDTEILVAVQAEEDAHIGVKKVEAAERVYGRFSKWFLFIGSVIPLSNIGTRH